MLFKVLSVDPICFDHEYLSQRIMRRSARLWEMLKFLEKSGILFRISEDWIEYVNGLINKYNDKDYKEDIILILKELDAKNRIHLCKNNKIKYDGRQWRPTIEKYKQYIDDVIMQSTLEEIDFTVPGNIVINQDLKAITEILGPIMPYVQKVQIIDPYFDMPEERYFLIFRQILSKAEHSCENDKKITITINGSIKLSSLGKDRPDQEIITRLKKWQQKIKEIETDFEYATVEARIWKEHYEEKIHDRYLITDVGSFSNGKGIANDPNAKLTWGILDSSASSEATKLFDKNSKNTLLYRVTSNEIRRSNKPTRYLVEDIAKELGMDFDDFAKQVESLKIPMIPKILRDQKISERQKERIKVSLAQ